jgi:hypothetical protein
MSVSGQPDTAARTRAIERYVGTGEYDLAFPAWTGNICEREGRGSADLLQSLVTRVKALEKEGAVPTHTVPADVVAFTRRKVEPMVRGLFRRAELDAVLLALEKSVVFLTPAAIEQVLLEQSLHTAWLLANIYLDSIDAPLLGPDAPRRLVGLSEETTCFVSLSYFAESDPFADFVVHETAHVFHNCLRLKERLEGHLGQVRAATAAECARPAAWPGPGHGCPDCRPLELRRSPCL